MFKSLFLSSNVEEKDLLICQNSNKNYFNLLKEAHFSSNLRAIPFSISSGLSVALLATISVLIAFGRT